jgi:glycosyltransferase involved in cell wall biosynthesis
MSNTRNDALSSNAPMERPGLAINGKFLQPSTSRSGVYRVARELVLALDRLLVDNDALAAAFPCRIFVPGDDDIGVRLSRIRIERDPICFSLSPARRRVTSVLWEQTRLPQLARGRTLVSLCNIGPVLHRDAFTMVHDAQVYTSPGSYSRLFRTWYRCVLPLLGRRNRALLTVSEYSKGQLDRFGVAAAKNIQVIHNGCDHVLRLGPDPMAVEAAGLSGAPYVLALANHQRHKNIQVLLQAFHAPALRETTLALFGPARREDFEAQGLRVPPNVRFLGFVSDERLAGLMRHAVALAFPSTTEGFGLPPLEAMALGCPTVVAPCGALPEVCGDASLWADALDPDAWIRHLVRLRDDPEMHAAVRSRGLVHSARFSWEKAATRLLESVLGRSLSDAGLLMEAASVP